MASKYKHKSAKERHLANARGGELSNSSEGCRSNIYSILGIGFVV